MCVLGRGGVGGGILAESPPGRSPFPLADLHTDAGLGALRLLIFGDPQAMPVPRSDQNPPTLLAPPWSGRQDWLYHICHFLKSFFHYTSY